MTVLPLVALMLCITPIKGCSFDGLLAQCPMVLGGHHVDVSARINHCHSPVDVSFLVVANNDRNPSSQNTDMSLRHRPFYWHYTYVTTNHPESREMPGYGQRVLLHVVADTRTERGGTAKRLKLKAQFLIDGHTDQSLTFVDDEVRLPHFDDCEFARKEDQVGNIALGCIVTVIVLCVIGLVGLWFFRPRKGGDDEIDLVNNMERPHMSPQRSTIPEDSNVHYVVPRPEETKENNSEELSVYISTPNGLQKLERKSSQNSSSTESYSSTSSSNPSSSHHNQPPTASHPLEDVERASSKMSSSSNESTNSNSIEIDRRSLGAIPKRRPPPLAMPSSPSTSSESSETSTSPSR